MINHQETQILPTSKGHAVVVLGSDCYQLELNCFGTNAHVLNFGKWFDRGRHSRMAVALDLRHTYRLPSWGGGISRSQRSPDCDVSVREGVLKMTVRRVRLLERGMNYQLIYGREFPTLSRYLSRAFSEVYCADWNVK